MERLVHQWVVGVNQGQKRGNNPSRINGQNFTNNKSAHAAGLLLMGGAHTTAGNRVSDNVSEEG